MNQPDRRSLAQQSQDDWEALRSVGELFPGTALGDSAANLPAWPENVQGSPIILADGDAGSLAIAARTARELRLVLTNNVDTARGVLDGLGRQDVKVASDPSAAAELEAVEGPVRWIGLGDPSFLVSLLPSDLAGRLHVTQLQVTGGAGPLLEAAADGRLKLDLVSANPADGELGPAVAVAGSLQLPFVDFRQVPVGLDATGRFQPAEGGVVLWWGAIQESGALQGWLERTQTKG